MTAPPAIEPAANDQRPLSKKTASYDDVKAAVEKRGVAKEAELVEAAREALPDRQVPRAWVRRARDDLFGKPPIGRPKSPK
jgi:hypothetical protein